MIITSLGLTSGGILYMMWCGVSFCSFSSEGHAPSSFPSHAANYIVFVSSKIVENEIYQ